MVQKFSGGKQFSKVTTFNLSFISTKKQRSLRGAVARTRAAESVSSQQFNTLVEVTTLEKVLIAVRINMAM